MILQYAVDSESTVGNHLNTIWRQKIIYLETLLFMLLKIIVFRICAISDKNEDETPQLIKQ